MMFLKLRVNSKFNAFAILELPFLSYLKILIVATKCSASSAGYLITSAVLSSRQVGQYNLLLLSSSNPLRYFFNKSETVMTSVEF